MADKIDPTLLVARTAGVKPTTGKQTVDRQPSPGEPDFASVLQAQEKETTLRLSNHAQNRLHARDIHLGQSEWAKLENAVERAGAKGAQQSLVLLDDLALVINIQNRVVITALDKESRRSNVFTQIDSAVIA